MCLNVIIVVIAYICKLLLPLIFDYISSFFVCWHLKLFLALAGALGRRDDGRCGEIINLHIESEAPSPGWLPQSN